MAASLDGFTLRALDAAIGPLVASFAAWGVLGACWRLDDAGRVVVWLRASTEIERVSLQAQPFIMAQTQVILIRLGAAHEVVKNLRLEMFSDEGRSG